MGTIAFQITSLTSVYSTVYSDADKNTKAPRHWPLCGEFTWDSPHKWAVTRKKFPFDEVIMWLNFTSSSFIAFMPCIYFKWCQNNMCETIIKHRKSIWVIIIKCAAYIWYQRDYFCQWTKGCFLMCYASFYHFEILYYELWQFKRYWNTQNQPMLYIFQEQFEFLQITCWYPR